MIDKGLDKLLMVFFGVSGITILILTWAQPMLLADKLLTIFIGSIGLF
jgi:hypothetical protein